jgi:hypothetical protein
MTSGRSAGSKKKFVFYFGKLRKNTGPCARKLLKNMKKLPGIANAVAV